MQRIDENTYIDDSLVTCAEYQLFIDDMRAQSQYFQPDHWTSYQFPQGQAQHPILGVRTSDATAFCKWLTWREVCEWRYRLPTFEEAAEYLLPPITQSPLGYWTIGKNHANKFVWVGSVHGNSSVLKIDQILAYGLDPVTASLVARASTRNFTIEIDIDIDLKSACSRDIDRVAARVYERQDDLDRHRGLDFTIDSDNTRATYAVLATFQERIFGRSPAFEGIRLVKERK